MSENLRWHIRLRSDPKASLSLLCGECGCARFHIRRTAEGLVLLKCHDCDEQYALSDLNEARGP